MEGNFFESQTEPTQTPEPVSKWNRAAIEALKLSAIVIVFFLLSYLTSPSVEQLASPSAGQLVISSVLSILKLAATFGFLWWAMKSFSAKNALATGQTTYGNVFSFGLIVSLLSGIVMAVFTFIWQQWITPEATQALKDVYFTQWSTILGDSHPSLEMVQSNFEILTTVGTLFSHIFYGLLWSAIIASFTKKNPDPMMQNQN